MVRLWHRLVRLWHRLSWIDCLRLVALGLVTGVALVAGLIVNLPLSVEVSHDVLDWFAQDQERYQRLLGKGPERAYLDGLSVAVLPALVRRDPRELVEALDRAQGDRYPGIEPRFVILELRDGTILTSSDARRFPAESLVVPNQLRRPGGEIFEHGTDRAWLERTLRIDGFRVGRLFASVEIRGSERARLDADRDERSRLRWSWVIGCLMTLLVLGIWLGISLGIYFVLKRTLPKSIANLPFLGPRQGTAGRIAELAFWIVIALLVLDPLFDLFQPSSSRVAQSTVADPHMAYEYAFRLLKDADYPAAEEALKSFIRQYPGDRLAGDARYWLGETYYARGDYAEAAAVLWEGDARFELDLYLGYPTIALEALLKLGTSLARANQKQNACATLHTVLVHLDDDFLNGEMRITGNAIKERTTDEKNKLGCSPGMVELVPLVMKPRH